MGWWTNFRDAAEALTPWESDSARKKTSGYTGAVNKLKNEAGGVVNSITGRLSASDKRDQQYAINDQIKAYKDQTALEEQQINAAKDQQDVLKRQINEKQIRALRSSFRAPGGYSSVYGANSNPAPTGTPNSPANQLGNS